MTRDPTTPARPTDPARPAVGKANDVAAFLKAAQGVAPPVASAHPRLVFALDATMSRQPTWDMAAELQGQMFAEAAHSGAIDIQLVYFRGLGECRASGWVSDATRMNALMRRIACQGGHTQIGRVLDHAAAMAAEAPLAALVYIGDAMEEGIDDLCARAAQLAFRKVPVFLFQEGSDPVAAQAFAEIARLTKGVHASFAPGAAQVLADLLRAVTIFATRGRAALRLAGERGDAGARLLISRMDQP